MADISVEIVRSYCDNGDEFAVNMSYNNNARKTFFVKRLHLTNMFQLYGTVYKWLLELGAVSSTWDVAIHKTILGLRELLMRSDSSSRALEVSIVAHSNDPYEPEPEPEPSESESEEIDEEATKGRYEWIKDILKLSGVSFKMVSSKSYAKNKKYGSCCVVCQEEFVENSNNAQTSEPESEPKSESESEYESFGVLLCSHVIHEACLLTWALKAPTTNLTCPLCRHQLIDLALVPYRDLFID